MRKLLVILVSGVMALALSACSSSGAGDGGTAATGSSGQAAANTPVTIKSSPDKYTWYVKNYVGMNAASAGFTSLAGDRRDSYGAGNIVLVLRTVDGSYVDPKDEDALKGYVVIAQDLAPNTELKLSFLQNTDGTEADSLVSYMNYDEIVLEIAKVGEKPASAPALTAIEPSPDKYTRYVKDYVGRNLAACGYSALDQSFNDHYGPSYANLDITTEDGSYVDESSVEALSGYVVTAQSVAPNTPLTMTYVKDPDGNDYSNLPDYQTLPSIGLTVKKLE